MKLLIHKVNDNFNNDVNIFLAMLLKSETIN